MENIFEKLGYVISKKRNTEHGEFVTVFFLNNPDGTPRWIWNANCKKPDFLKFYNAGATKARIYIFLIKAIFALKMQHLFFKSEVLFFSKKETSFFNCLDAWSLFTGTIGPNNKAILYVNSFFYKIATTPNAQLLIQKEHTVLQKMDNEVQSFVVPNSKFISHAVIQFSDIAEKGKRTKNATQLHANALLEMSNRNKKTQMVSDWESFQNLKANFDAIQDNRIPSNLIRKINWLLANMDKEETLETTFSHGDFTQWNMFVTKDKLAIYDWELAANEMPKGFDFFHYTIQKGILVDRLPWKTIYQLLQQQIATHPNLFEQPSEGEFQRYLKWYLLVCTMHYLTVYAAQPKWHMQVDWLLQTWNEGLNTFLSEEKTSRELLIMDLFDTLHNHAYAALKYNNGYPEQLSITSDIDMITNKNGNEIVLKLVENHALISKVTVHKKSFMNTIQIITNQGDFLSIDLIWQVKRRNLTLLNTTKILANNYRNSFGVKTTSVIDTARYIALFYVLNGAKIPKKYLVYEQALTNSKNKLDIILQDYFIDKKRDKKTVVAILKKQKQNKKWFYIKNTALYVLDTIRNVFQNKGFTVTFSGVDGAGKTTIIDNVRFQMEKQLRKPVVVLRHRPSIFPILSVWTKGKEQAHLDAVSSLPRQGNNKNFLSSLVRFSYYFLDYVLGQFVIYCKYILRGYVVIYDRYYFDFINDSKRSNIELPKWISRIGYRFLLKPEFNFFLFADAQTILSRKKELNRATIEELTHEYRLLFQKLQAKSSTSIYKAIQNEQIDSTLQNIIGTIKADRL